MHNMSNHQDEQRLKSLGNEYRMMRKQREESLRKLKLNIYLQSAIDEISMQEENIAQAQRLEYEHFINRMEKMI